MYTRVTDTTTAVPGKFAFFSKQDQREVLAGTIHSVSNDGKTITIHEHRQAPQRQRRFTPLYKNNNNNKYEVRTKIYDYHSPVHVDMDVSDLIVTGEINDYYIDETMLDKLKSVGVLHE